MNNHPAYAKREQAPQKRSRWGFRGKTFWDWLQLLVIPVLLAGLAVGLTAWFNGQQGERQRVLEEQRAQDEALQLYLNQMSELLLEEDLRDAEEDSEVRTLARARTLTVLGRLDASRKAEVMQFLEEANLIQGEGERDPIIYLSGANLNETDLVYANLIGAALNGAHLTDADLRRARLNDANLVGARLNDANLVGADLTDADLNGTEGWTDDQLAQAKSLKGATMPNGQKYEDWLKDRESGGEDGE